MTSLDRLSPLLERFRVRTRLFHTGPLCGVTAFPAQPGRGFLHVLRDGDMEVTHPGADRSLERIRVGEPSLLFYPRPTEHAFHNAPVDGADFACATLDFDGGPTHPLVRALPSVTVLPLHEVDTLGPTLDLLFAEVDRISCGQRLLVDRLFEVVLIQLFRWIVANPDRLRLDVGLVVGLSDDRLAPALIAVHEAPGEDWTLSSMAARANMSRSAFAARFKEKVGQPPADYLTDWRLTVAQERLRRGAAVSVVAGELGYSTPSAFSRVFSQRLGRSPRAWLAAS
ncbi:putative AraC family transcriptional regulator [Gordonia araii NBRC 100433]|uniref:Putative AraC family transcriptional regulator n=1 Tax=Gordonia araii NBRC 100433 TaxID=1073574 RepID=G7H170_9ACTN|nr:AraC family transcriptional regulator [Gordonia araii]NNG96782.1 AraC family transcriptional regulator [Gordonia araii NBRC 100433]GAB09530.1 putative AraC family transcriptional regulator [Gordonia araii NBRC 100433]